MVVANFLFIAYCAIICYSYNKVCFTWAKILEREVLLRFWKVWHRFMTNIFCRVKQILLDQTREGLWNTYCFPLMTPDIIEIYNVFATNSWSTAFTKCVSANHTNVYETSFIFGEWLHWLLEYEKRFILWHTIELKVLQYYSFTKLHAKFDLAWTYWLIRMHHISLARICSQAWPEIKLFQKDINIANQKLHQQFLQRLCDC